MTNPNIPLTGDQVREALGAESSVPMDHTELVGKLGLDAFLFMDALADQETEDEK